MRTLASTRVLGVLQSLAIVAVGWVLLRPRPSLAADLRHRDLRSLAYLSEAVVRATAVDGIQDVELQTFRVLSSYQGSLAVGETFRARWSSVSLRPNWIRPKPVSVADEVVMFLSRGRDGEWWLVDSGLRVFDSEQTYRFVQFENPGPYEPTPQGVDPYDLYGDPRAGEGQARGQFLDLLTTRIAQADAFATIFAPSERPGVRDQLLAAVGPALGQDNLEPTSLSLRNDGFEDVVAIEVINRMVELGDVERMLEAVSRIRGGVAFWDLRAVMTLNLVGYARDTMRPEHHRIAALELLQHTRLDSSKSARALLALVSDPSPSIRAAAVVAGPRDGLPPAWREALVRQAAVETDSKVLYEILMLGRRFGFEGDLRGTHSWPIVTAKRRGRSVSFAWTDGPEDWSLERLVLEAHTASGTQEVTWLPPPDGSHARDGSGGAIRGYALFSPSIPDKTFHLDVRARFVRGAEVRPIVLALRPVGTGVAVSAGQRLERLEVTKNVAPHDDPEPTASPPGCSCTATGQLPLAGDIGVAVVLILCTRRRRTTCS